MTVEIRTTDGISLDLAPDMEFELTMENPIMNNDYIPTPFSTSISFPPSPGNCKVFGFVDALMLQPSVLKIGCVIFVSGIPVITGTLAFDSVDENKNLCYAFSGTDYTKEWGKKIFEIQDILTGDYTTIQIELGQFQHVKAPLIIVSGFEAEPSIEPSESGEYLIANPKFYNDGPGPSLLFNIDRLFIPAVSLSFLATQIIGDSLSDFLLESISGLYILGTHRTPENTTYRNPDIGSFLPDISKADFIKEVCKISASFVFGDGSGLKIVSAKEILQDTSFLDWSDRISDIFSQHKEDAEGYKFGFSESSFDSKVTDTSSESIKTVDTLSDLVTLPDLEGYKPFQYSKTGDIFSEKTIWAVYYDDSGGHSYNELLSDKVLDTAKNIDISGDAKRDNTVSFKSPRCVPTWNTKDVPPSSAKIAPIVAIPALNSDRETTAYIGAIINNQFCDRGYVFVEDSLEEYIDSDKSLNPEALFQKYHQELAEWIGKPKQVIKADLNLSVIDIAGFRMWKKVLFKQRPFLVKQLSIRFSVGAGVISSSGEFISL